MQHPEIASRTRAPLPPLLLAATLFSGCGMNPPQRPPQEPGFQQQAHRPGYLPERRYQASPIREAWQLGKTTVDTVYLAPASAEALPLVVYLPGLGESAAAGQLWRQNWAEAGYAVLSLQPAELGEAAWPADKTDDNRDQETRERQRRHSLERRDRVREQYAATALTRRLDLVAQAVGELRHRAAGSLVYGTVDTTRLIVAGYDIGAQAAAALAGEQIKGVRPPNLGLKAAILLSPYAELTAGSGKERFAEMQAPLLAITGSEDDDPDYLVSTPSLRRIPWQGAPAGDKYLLVLENGIHTTLAGNASGNRDGGPGGMARGDGRQPPGGGAPRALPFGGGGPGGGPGGGGPGGMMGGPPGGRSNERGSPGSNFANQHAGIVQAVSTAFLDAVVKNDPVADEWLHRNATRWLAGQAGLWIR